MKLSASRNLESENIICCLEFLSQEALGKEMLKEHAILQSTIAEIAKNTSSHKRKIAYENYSEIVNAFKFFAKFCLIEDADIKKQLIQVMENIDKEVLLAYADCA